MSSEAVIHITKSELSRIHAENYSLRIENGLMIKALESIRDEDGIQKKGASDLFRWMNTALLQKYYAIQVLAEIGSMDRDR